MWIVSKLSAGGLSSLSHYQKLGAKWTPSEIDPVKQFVWCDLFYIVLELNCNPVMRLLPLDIYYSVLFMTYSWMGSSEIF